MEINYIRFHFIVKYHPINFYLFFSLKYAVEVSALNVIVQQNFLVFSIADFQWGSILGS